MFVRTMYHSLGLVVVLMAIGCGGSGPKTKVSGSVTYNGKSVEDGYIVFRPADGKGGDAGGPISGGNFSFLVPSGPKVVIISNGAAPETGRVLTSEEASKMKADPKKGSEIIDPNAKGNNTKVDVSGTEQSLNFALKSS
jgi:hypothetical protein